MSKETNETAQLDLFNGLFHEIDENIKRTRKRFDLSDSAIKKLDWIVKQDKKKNLTKKRYYPYHTIERLIENEYHMRRNMEGEK